MVSFPPDTKQEITDAAVIMMIEPICFPVGLLRMTGEPVVARQGQGSPGQALCIRHAAGGRGNGGVAGRCCGRAPRRWVADKPIPNSSGFMVPRWFGGFGALLLKDSGGSTG